MSALEASLRIGEQTYRVDLARPVSLAIPLCFDGAQPNAFGLDRASSATFRAGGFVADVRQGGPVNCRVLTLTPHGNGTHTESVGHIVSGAPSAAECLTAGPVAALLVTATPTPGAATDEGRPPCADPEDTLVTRAELEAIVTGVARRAGVPLAAFVGAALIVRTQADDRLHDANWSEMSPPYFSTEAAAFVADGPWQHWLTDLPSVDRDRDDGLLTNHRSWWRVPAGRNTIDDCAAPTRTITEMIRVPVGITDGLYVCHIEVPALETDAVPSRPMLYPLAPAR